MLIASDRGVDPLSDTQDGGWRPGTRPRRLARRVKTVVYRHDQSDACVLLLGA
jgi:hypothetical protein